MAAVAMPLLTLAAIEAAGTAALAELVDEVAEAQRRSIDTLERTRRAQTALVLAVYRHRLTGDLPAQSEIVRLLDAFRREIQSAAGDEGARPEWDSFLRLNEAFMAEAAALLLTRDVSDEDLDELLRLQSRSSAALRSLTDESFAELRRATEELDSDVTGLRALTIYGVSACLLFAVLASAATIRLAASTLRRLDAQSKDLEDLSAELIAQQENAARRFSHELHDDLGQTLIAAKAGVVSLKNDDSFVEDKAAAVELLNEAIEGVRNLSHMMHPTVLEHFGLDGALRSLTERFGERTGIETVYRSTFEGRLPDEARTHLYRIAQEAFTNVVKHSNARRVQVDLSQVEDEVILEISDNGRGLPAVNKSVGIGMRGMQARAAFAGGDVEFVSKRGKGLTIRVRAPLQGGRRGNDSTDQDSGGG